jgi:hypothetical protein
MGDLLPRHTNITAITVMPNTHRPGTMLQK